jgi:hypothetical protein
MFVRPRSAIRSRLRWAVAVPLVLAGSSLAHAVAYRVAFPSSAARSADLEASGHGYLDQLPLALALLFGLLLVGLVANVRDILRGSRREGAPAWLFATLPPLVFTLQEHLERYVHTGQFPVDAVVEPSFAIGLGLQLPFALLALLVARLLVRVTQVVAQRLAGRLPLRLATPRSTPAPRDVLVARMPVLASGRGSRGPPLA